MLAGCAQQQPGVAAPLNNLQALEKLASAYEAVSEQIPVSPASLAPKARKKFVIQVFENAGYNYHETLKEISKIKTEEITKLHRDLLELLFMPHHGLSADDMKLIYSEEELVVINKTKSTFK